MAKEKRYDYRYLGSKKHKTVALLLCLVCGFLGLHYFYVGRKLRGALNVVLAAILAFAGGYFIVYGAWSEWTILFRFGGLRFTDWLYLHWREVVTAICAITLTVMWAIDLVTIWKGELRDSEKMKLK